MASLSLFNQVELSRIVSQFCLTTLSALGHGFSLKYFSISVALSSNTNPAVAIYILPGGMLQWDITIEPCIHNVMYWLWRHREMKTTTNLYTNYGDHKLCVYDIIMEHGKSITLSMLCTMSYIINQWRWCTGPHTRLITSPVVIYFFVVIR